jgi:hypothetical protein
MFAVSIGNPRNEKVETLVVKVKNEQKEFLYRAHLAISVIDSGSNHVRINLTREQALSLIDELNKAIKQP